MTAERDLTDPQVAEPTRMRLVVRGAVQGVGFRPLVYRRAVELGLSGWVMNTLDGVVIEAEGEPGRLDALTDSLARSPPPNASVAQIERSALLSRGGGTFEIRESAAKGGGAASILPDLSTCESCLREVLDPADRRYLYPFANCTACGPRYSVIEALPYDRSRTSMRPFEMCADCRAEYEDPRDRRFHAEPIACPQCGPRLSLWDPAGTVLAERHEALCATAEALRQGRIVAVKGLGGFHLMVDARDGAAVARLRARKRRPDKPFAAMFPSIAAIEAACHVSSAEAALLVSPPRPIVLLRRHGTAIASDVSPRNAWIGAMLPYTPLHHLLLRETGAPLVATSGNVSDEPIVTDERDALGRLAGIADLFLVHDRPIVRPVEDSLARIVAGRAQIHRRARGYAPAPIARAPTTPAGLVALGGHLKATVAIATGAGVVLGPHIGDLDGIEAREVHRRTVDDLARLHDVRPNAVIHDLHPDYATTRIAETSGLPSMAVQHHVAHIAACMAEHGLAPPVLGVAWDGGGYGPDGTVWGGEFLLVGADDIQRVAHLRRFRLPGGEAAIREPRRAALGLLFEMLGPAALEIDDLAPVHDFAANERNVLRAMLLQGVNAPLTSSAGRLFDAVAALCGLRQRASYEGQAAIELEGLVAGQPTGRGYAFGVRETPDGGEAHWLVDWEPALRAIVADIREGERADEIAARFHAGLASAIAAVAAKTGVAQVALSGGCFQNAALTEMTIASLRAAGHDPYWHREVPTNDGGIAFGQIAWAARRATEGKAPCA